MVEFSKKWDTFRVEITMMGTTTPVVSIDYDYIGSYELDTEMVAPFTIKLFPRENYEIVEAYTTNRYSKKFYATILDDGSAIIEDNTFGGVSGLTLGLTGITVQEKPSVPSDLTTPFNHVYSMTIEQLIDFSNERFEVGVVNDVIDLGQYIINILELPFPLDENYYNGQQQIKLYNRTLETFGESLATDFIELDLGVINVPLKYNNAFDYVNTNTIFHLPFMENFEIPIEYVIGCEIGIKYLIDVYSGNATMNISSSKLDGEVVHTAKFKIGKSIPFIQTYGSREVLGDRNNMVVFNNITTAFIEVIRNKPYALDNPFNNNTTRYTQLKNESGFIQVTNSDIQGIATTTELEYIKSILNEGVFIK